MGTVLLLLLLMALVASALRYLLEPPEKNMPKTDAWIVGYAEAERRFYEWEATGDRESYPTPNFWDNPFREGTEQHAGFEEGFRDFTQK